MRRTVMIYLVSCGLSQIALGWRLSEKKVAEAVEKRLTTEDLQVMRRQFSYYRDDSLTTPPPGMFTSFIEATLGLAYVRQVHLDDDTVSYINPVGDRHADGKEDSLRIGYEMSAFDRDLRQFDRYLDELDAKGRSEHATYEQMEDIKGQVRHHFRRLHDRLASITALLKKVGEPTAFGGAKNVRYVRKKQLKPLLKNIKKVGESYGCYIRV